MKNGVKIIQAAAYNGARTILKVPGGSSVDLISIGAYFLMASW